MRRRVAPIPVIVFLLLAAGACTERRLWVRTEPAGARVRVNGTDVGVAPVSWRFDHYGTVLVEAQLDGYEPVERAVRLRSPWWQKPGIDFVSDVLLPVRVRDDHELKIRLRRLPRLGEKQVERRIETLTERAARLRAEVKGE